MFSKLLGKKNSVENKELSLLEEKIAKMDLAEMRLYVNGKLESFKVSEFGLNEVVKKLISKNADSSKYYIAENDLDSKRKKALNLLVLILENKNISVLIVESAQEFLEVYEEMINKYDYDNQDIYKNRIKKLINLAIQKIDAKSTINEVIGLTS